jgi:cytochrome c-type biogenesis protein CcmH/NrfG
LQPHQPKYACSEAFFLRQAGYTAEAQRVLEKLVADSPSCVEAYSLLGEMLEEQHKTAAALALYRTAVANTNFTGESRFRFVTRIRKLSGN